jgi:hypothetical protein
LTAVALPSGEQIPARRLSIIDDSVRWDGDELRVSLADAARAEAADAARAEAGYLHELVRERREPEMAEVRQRLAALEKILTQTPDNGKES